MDQFINNHIVTNKLVYILALIIIGYNIFQSIRYIVIICCKIYKNAKLRFRGMPFDLPRLCKQCKKSTLNIDYSMQLLSDPSQYNASCPECGWKGSVPC